jgi:hypothetical protein
MCHLAGLFQRALISKYSKLDLRKRVSTKLFEINNKMKNYEVKNENFWTCEGAEAGSGLRV